MNLTSKDVSGQQTIWIYSEKFGHLWMIPSRTRRSSEGAKWESWTLKVQFEQLKKIYLKNLAVDMNFSLYVELINIVITVGDESQNCLRAKKIPPFT